MKVAGLMQFQLFVNQKDIETISLFPFVKKIKPVKGYKKKKYFNEIDIYQLDGPT